MSVFLRDGALSLWPTAAAPPPDPSAWLDAGERLGDEVVLALRDEHGEERALVGVACLDWVARRGCLFAGAAENRSRAVDAVKAARSIDPHTLAPGPARPVSTLASPASASDRPAPPFDGSFSPGPTPPWLEQALRLVLAYARDELAIEEIEASPATGEVAGLLERLGFQSTPGGPFLLRLGDPLRGHR